MVRFLSLELKNVFYEAEITKCLIRVHDRKFCNLFTQSISDFGIREIVTAFCSPWQNGYVERVIGSIGKEFLDHIIVMNENHLRKLLKDYFCYYNAQRKYLE